MKKSYSVLMLTCLAAVFAIFIVLNTGYAQQKAAIPPTSPAVDVNPTDLPEKFNQLKMGMNYDQVKQLLGHPVTIRPMGGDKREWKYYLPGGVARLYLNFQANKIVSIQKRTP
jgi:outer membrane protein assembly factor BamE (lipoprotein component of BamABCDE complex)